MQPAAYDAWYDSPAGRWTGETEYRLVTGLLGAVAGEQLLDVGCGTGWFTRRLAAGGGLRVTGVDIDEVALGFARRHDPHADYLVGDARALPFADGAFDRVVSVTALCFVADWPRALAEIIRVSRLRFVIGLLNRHSLLHWQRGRGGGSGGYRGAHWHTRKEVERALEGLPACGLQWRSAILLPGGSWVARRLESLAGGRSPYGAFLALAGSKPGAPSRH